MTELRSKHLWPLVEQFATTDTSDPENTVPGWVALAMLDDLRRLQQTVPAPQAQGVSEPLYHTPLYCHVDHAGDEAWIALTPYPDDGSADGVMFSSQYWDTGIPQDVYALFERVAEMTQQPAPQAQGVPVEIADILRPLVDEVHWARYGSEDDEQRAALVRDWLDSQRPAPGQEVGDV